MSKPTITERHWKCMRSLAGSKVFETGQLSYAAEIIASEFPESEGVSGGFYNGIEHFACWLLDHYEGKRITEELLREWAVEAWEAKPTARKNLRMARNNVRIA